MICLSSHSGPELFIGKEVKNLFFFLFLFFAILIQGCADKSPIQAEEQNPFSGIWSINLAGGYSSGQLLYIDAGGGINGFVNLQTGAEIFAYKIDGSVSKSGIMTAALLFPGHAAGSVSGNFSGDSGRGTWSAGTLYGSWSVRRTSVISDTTLRVTHLSDSSAGYGEKIIAYGKNFSRCSDHLVFFNNKYVISKITSDTTISVFIPYKAQTGNFRFNFYRNGKITIISPPITITELCQSDLCIGWNTKAPFVEMDSWVPGWITGTVKWSMTVDGDTVFITRMGSCGDECSLTNTLAFIENNQSGLPQFLFARYYMLERMPTREVTDTMLTGYIRIDKWNQEVYSGSFVNDTYDWVFWINR